MDNKKINVELQYLKGVNDNTKRTLKLYEGGVKDPYMKIRFSYETWRMKWKKAFKHERREV